MRPPLVPGRVTCAFLWGAEALFTCITAYATAWQSSLYRRFSGSTGEQWAGWVGDKSSSVVRIPTEVAGPRKPLHENSSEPKSVGTYERLPAKWDVCFPGPAGPISFPEGTESETEMCSSSLQRGKMRCTGPQGCAPGNTGLWNWCHLQARESRGLQRSAW